VLVLDAGVPRNAPATQVHSYLGHEGIDPRELPAIGRSEVGQYGGTIRSGTAVRVERVTDSALRDTTSDGTTAGARRVLVATGVVDELPGAEPPVTWAAPRPWFVVRWGDSPAGSPSGCAPMWRSVRPAHPMWRSVRQTQPTPHWGA
jgi:hypothetical protein